MCRGQTITEVIVRTRPPYPEGLLRHWEELARLARGLHVTTDPKVVRRFLAFEPGQPCSPIRLAESERILRLQPYLADAVITAIPVRDGVVIDVETVDEISAVVGLSVVSESPYLNSLRLGDRNVMGTAVEFVGRWRDDGVYGDSWSGHLVDRQFLGEPYELALAGASGELSRGWLAQAAHPFYTDLQRVAWRVSASERRDYYPFLREHGETPRLSVERAHADIGGVIRVGHPGRLSLFGVAISSSRSDPAAEAVILTPQGFADDTSPVLDRRYESYEVARANVLWGVRNIEFIPVYGFDVLTGVQDVRTGFQFGAMFGRSLPVLGSEDDDIFLAADLYAGNGSRRVFWGVQLQAEGRQNYDEKIWDEILTSGRAALYLKPTRRHTLVASGEWSGGWGQRIPFQLALGEKEGGVRGYADSRAAGAQRAVFRVEDRFFLGRPRGLADAGLAAFVDAGRVWAGDVPFGVTTPIKVGVGLGLLAAIPPRSRRLWRLDVAYAASPDPHAQWQIRLSSNDATRGFWVEPPDIQRVRSRATPFSVFNWP